MSDERHITDIDDGAARRYATLARTVTPEDRQRLTPPADLWGSIAGALDQATSDVDQVLAGGPTGASASVVAAPTHTSTEPAQVSAAVTGSEVVVPMGRRLFPIVLSAAAAIVLFLGVVALAISGDDDAPAGELVAIGTLEALADGFEGGVELVDIDGRLGLDLDVGELPETTDAYYELWLIKDLETGEMQSLGPIDGSGRVDLPRGLDPAQYATVDISVEPLDGVPTHSGQSVLRGELDI